MDYHIPGSIRIKQIRRYYMGQERNKNIRRLSRRQQSPIKKLSKSHIIKGVQGLKNKGNHIVILRIKIPAKLN